jgi:hypothetical protein
MFVQVIKGKVTDREGARRLMDRWNAELRPGADGFLGATIGITDDGTMINAARFASREQAMANSSRAEQGAWWAEFEKCFADSPTFRESEDITIYQRGDLDSAGFVQIMEGHVHDVERARSFAKDAEDMLASERPDLLGDVMIIYPDSTSTDIAYFASEAEARAGESKELSSAAQEAMQQMEQLFSVDEYLDIREPHLY